MRLQFIVAALIALSTVAANAKGNPEAGRDLVLGSCTSCHAPNNAAAASDQAPPLSFIARDAKRDPTWIHGWLMDPHPPAPALMLSRQQVDDIIAYLNTLPVSD
jgi:cytochrome c